MFIVADNIQITNPVIALALEKQDHRPIQKLAKRCEAAGAHAIDLNSGPLNLDPARKMRFLVETVQAVSALPLFLDTSNPKALEGGLEAAENKVVINGFSLEQEKLNSILPLAAQFNADIIGYLLNPDSQVPTDANDRLMLAYDLFEKCQKAGIKKEQLIIDPVIAPVQWQDGNRQAMEILTVLRSLPDLLGYDVRTIAGISNLTSGPGKMTSKMTLEQGYIAMLTEAGLSMALINVFHTQTIQIIKACTALKNNTIFSWEEIT